MLRKIILAVKSIKNLHILILDFLGFFKRDAIYKLRNGIHIVARGGSTDYAEIIIINADSEYPSRFFPRNIRPVILDIGAHIGVFSLLITKKLSCKNPSIFAIEPGSSNYSYLEKNVRLNNFRCIKSFKLAMTGKTGKGFLFLDGNKYDGCFVGMRKNDLLACEKISTISLEDFCKAHNISIVDLMKMDIEGSEYDVFESSINFIKKHVRSIFVELHNIDKNRNYLTFKNYIVKHGFSIDVEIMNRTLFLRNNKLKNEKI